MVNKAKILRPKPVVLVILDGWGVAPPCSSNAISLAKLPTFDYLIKNYPAMTLQASGESVGLSWGEVGNSEVGHLSLGAGRIVYQNLPRINRSINDGSFYKNEVLLKAIENCQKNKSKLHLMGLLSAGGVHSSILHLFGLLDLCQKQKFKEVYIHVFLDGRDTPFNSGLDFIKQLQEKLAKLKFGHIATISGRFYAMDRDNHWERIEQTFRAMVNGESVQKFDDPEEAVNSSYAAKIFDEEFVPTVITKKGEPLATVTNYDSLIFFNFRADRARQLSKAFTLPGFDKFPRPYFANLFFVGLTEYDKDLPMQVAFPEKKIQYTLAQTVSEAGLKQLHVAETEKYAHVTYFFNGGNETKFSGEDHVMIPSARVNSFAEKPEMSAKEIIKKTTEEILTDQYDLIVVNLANADMVAHTANLTATIKALETIDSCLKNLTDVVLAKNGVMAITADHGNAEELVNLQTGEIDKEHSNYPVPLILVGNQWLGQTAGLPETLGGDLSLIPPVGVLADVAPTILKVMGLKQPEEMTGRSLI